MLTEGIAGQDVFSGRQLSSFERANDVLTIGLDLFTLGWGAAFGGVGAEAELGVVLAGACSFDANTPIATEQGETPIGQLQVGDKVLAYNQDSNSTGYYTVTAVLVNQDPTIEYLTIDGETLETTPEHPFFTQEQSWVAAGELKTGEHIRKADGSWGEVQQVQVIQQAKKMYNLTVDKAHTFFVGDEQWLVHNTCAGPTQQEAQEGARYVARAKQIFEAHKSMLQTSEKSYREVLVTEDSIHGEVVLISGGSEAEAARTYLRNQGLNVLSRYSNSVEDSVSQSWFPRERNGSTFRIRDGEQYHVESNAAIAKLQGDIDNNVWGIYSLDTCGKCRGYLQRFTRGTSGHDRIVVVGPNRSFVAEDGDFFW